MTQAQPSSFLPTILVLCVLLCTLFFSWKVKASWDEDIAKSLESAILEENKTETAPTVSESVGPSPVDTPKSDNVPQEPPSTEEKPAQPLPLEKKPEVEKTPEPVEKDGLDVESLKHMLENQEDETLFVGRALLRGLNKITARTSMITTEVGSVTPFGSLEIRVRLCWRTPPDQVPDSKALLEIWEKRLNAPQKRVFYGWVFASNPGVSSLEHSVYDVVLIKCLPK